MLFSKDEDRRSRRLGKKRIEQGRRTNPFLGIHLEVEPEKMRWRERGRGIESQMIGA